MKNTSYSGDYPSKIVDTLYKVSQINPEKDWTYEICGKCGLGILLCFFIHNTECYDEICPCCGFSLAELI